VDAVGLKVGEVLGMVVDVDDGNVLGKVVALGLAVGDTVLVGDVLGKALGRTVGDTVLVGDDEREGVVVGKALTDGDWVGHPSPNRIEVSEDPNSPPSAMIPSS
jgi:hypothetical protein